MRQLVTSMILIVCIATLGSCAQMVSKAKQDFASDLSAAILQHNEPRTVELALPAYLLLIDSMVRGDDRNIPMLITASKLYAAYTGTFVEDGERRIILAGRAFAYAHRALCLHVGQKNVTACNLHEVSYAAFEASLDKFRKEDVELLFTLGTAWAGKLQANSADWNAVAELPRVRAVIQRVLELDEDWSNGDAHVYMGVMESLIPPAMGGKPQQAKLHFEKALKISGRKNSMALLYYAEKYARLVFERKLHDDLLEELLALKPEDTPSKLIDAVAKARAQELLAGSADYF